MIVVTGGAGFIGSAVIWKLNQSGQDDILVVDELGSDDKWQNLVSLSFTDYIDKDVFIDRIIRDEFGSSIEAIIHLGACSSTTEKDASFLIRNNYEYSKHLAAYSANSEIRFIYASSAATYGDGSQGYNDDELLINSLSPLNMYGYSKHLFDLWAKKNGLLDKIAGLKFFNVYGPNEYHKGDMRSLVVKAFEQVQKDGVIRLFKSYKDDFHDGEQKRDFFYVKDAVDIVDFFLTHKNINGIFNVGSGFASTWNDLANAVFAALGKTPNIEYIEMPESLRNSYQYFTEADMTKLKEAGYKTAPTSLDDAVRDYVQNYLLQWKHLS